MTFDSYAPQKRVSLNKKRNIANSSTFCVTFIFQGWRLPYQFIYVAWFLVAVTTFLCAFFIMLYSMEWGKKKSEEWVTTFLMSFIESVFCLDPVKVHPL